MFSATYEEHRKHEGHIITSLRTTKIVFEQTLWSCYSSINVDEDLVRIG